MTERRSFSLFVTLLLVLSCKEGPDPQPQNPPPTGPETGFVRMKTVPKLVPWTEVILVENKFPGTASDYQLKFGNVPVGIDQVYQDSIRIFVPKEAPPGEYSVKLTYQGQVHDIGTVEVLDPKSVLPYNIAVAVTENEEYPLFILDSLGNEIIPHVSMDGTVDVIGMVSASGTVVSIELNEQGLPAHIYTETQSYYLDGYDLDSGKVNVARFQNINIEIRDSIKIEYGVPIRKEYIDVLIAARNSFGGRSKANELSQTLDVVGSVVGISSCIIAWIPPLTGLVVAGALLGCTDAVMEVINIIKPGIYEDQTNTSAVIALGLSLKDCFRFTNPSRLLTKADDLLEAYRGCQAAAFDAIKGLGDQQGAFNAIYETANDVIKKILNTGYGDIKVTLEWGENCDVDLHVTEPSGEIITYMNPTSSTGGQLDIDNTYGLGPENVFWPQNQAPFGTYVVKVHFYGSPEGGPTTSNFRVEINNFGRKKVFNGFVSTGEMVTVTTFQANQPWSTSGRMAPFKVESVSPKVKK